MKAWIILTDHINCSVKYQLNEVLDQIRDKHLGTLNTEWYYRFLKVEPLILERHQLVYKTLDEYMHGEIHALTMKTYTPEEHQKTLDNS